MSEPDKTAQVPKSAPGTKRRIATNTLFIGGLVLCGGALVQPVQHAPSVLLINDTDRTGSSGTSSGGSSGTPSGESSTGGSSGTSGSSGETSSSGTTGSSGTTSGESSTGGSS